MNYSNIIDSFKECFVFINDMANFVVFLADALGTVPAVFIVFFSLALLLGVAFGFFHLIVEIVVH